MSRQGTKQQHSDKGNIHSRLPDVGGWIFFAGLMIGGAGLDLWSKKAIFEWLGNAESGNVYSVIPGFFQLVPRLNSGAAFSIFQGQREILAGISILAFLIILVLFLLGRFHRRIIQIAMGCITAGITGNLYDRIFNEGFVRDFLDVYIGTHHWPTFNVADSLLCIGVGLILLANFMSETDQKPDRPQKSEP